MWTEEDGPEWRMLWVILKNGKLKGGKDPRNREQNFILKQTYVKYANIFKISLRYYIS